jgi:hypothetical protein
MPLFVFVSSLETLIVMYSSCIHLRFTDTIQLHLPYIYTLVHDVDVTDQFRLRNLGYGIIINIEYFNKLDTGAHCYGIGILVQFYHTIVYYMLSKGHWFALEFHNADMSFSDYFHHLKTGKRAIFCRLICDVWAIGIEDIFTWSRMNWKVKEEIFNREFAVLWNILNHSLLCA